MRVLVIGAGASGLSSIKACLEKGFDPICYEAEEDLGGLWRFTAQESNSSVYRSTVINTSKEMMCFSDFPIPAKYPPFMSHEMIIEYFKSYADHFKLTQRIEFNTRVEKVTRADDWNQTGRYLVESLNKKTSERKTEIFDAVMVCSGHHWKPNKPNIPGLDKFKGKVIHSHAYKDQVGFEDKNVLVIGVGNSGVDVAVELSRYSNQVFLSTRSGTWVSNRIFGGLPADFFANIRFSSFFPFKVKTLLTDFLLKQMNGPLEPWGLTPRHSSLSAHPTINGELIGRIAVGKIKVKPDIVGITGENEVTFEDGTVTSQIDAIIFCTGYEISFPFIDSESTGLSFIDNKVELYKYIFPPPPKNRSEKPKETLSFIGLIQPWGAIMPISEMQARWVTGLLKGEFSLPSGADMWRDIEAKKLEMARRYKSSKRHTIQVDYVSYMDELAHENGTYPSFWKLFINYNPSLAFRAVFGPATPPFYRLLGIGKWDGAQKAIDETYERNFFPTMTRKVEEKKGPGLWKVVVYLLVLLAIVRFGRQRLSF